MGKSGGFLTPKAISNRIKAKGLQKLRWYCQMCQKQCRDENGMRCHMKSEGHLRAMRVFADAPGKFLSDFSQQFEKGFLDTLSHRHGTKRVSANRVYQEYIGDKHHIHMNSTCWSSLTGLCKHLGREGKCVVDETEKGWFIQYIDRDPKLIAKKALEDSRKRSDLDEETRMTRMIESQIAAAKIRQVEGGGDDEEEVEADDEYYDCSEEGENDEMEGDEVEGDEETNMEDEEEEAEVDGVEVREVSNGVDADAEVNITISNKKVGEEPKVDTSLNLKKERPVTKIAMKSKKPPAPPVSMSLIGMTNKKPPLKPAISFEAVLAGGGKSTNVAAELPLESTINNSVNLTALPTASSSTATKPTGGPLSSLESLMREEERRKASLLAAEDRKDRKDYWLHPGIVVKILSKKLADGKYYKQKGTVLAVQSQYVADIRVEGAVVRIDQSDLQSVLPKVGNKLLVVNGRGRGCRALLTSINEEKFNCDIRIEEGVLAGRDVLGVDYEDVCKLAETI